MSSANKIRWAVIGAVAVPVVLITGYCGYQIYNTGKPVVNTQHQPPLIEKPLSDSDRVWGAAPASACAALENVNVITSPYALIDSDKKLYGCSTSEIEIPNQKDKKTLQYMVTGFSDKATNIKIVMRIAGSQATDEAIVAKKSWAIYSAVLTQTVFSQQLTEQEMQQLSTLKEGESFKRNFNLQLISDASFKEENKVGIYTYEIRGLPVLNGG